MEGGQVPQKIAVMLVGGERSRDMVARDVGLQTSGRKPQSHFIELCPDRRVHLALDVDNKLLNLVVSERCVEVIVVMHERWRGRSGRQVASRGKHHLRVVCLRQRR